MRSQIHADANEVGNPARYEGDDEADPHASEMKNLFFLLLGTSPGRGASPRFVPPIKNLTVGTALGAGELPFPSQRGGVVWGGGGWGGGYIRTAEASRYFPILVLFKQRHARGRGNGRLGRQIFRTRRD